MWSKTNIEEGIRPDRCKYTKNIIGHSSGAGFTKDGRRYPPDFDKLSKIIR